MNPNIDPKDLEPATRKQIQNLRDNEKRSHELNATNKHIVKLQGQEDEIEWIKNWLNNNL